MIKKFLSIVMLLCFTLIYTGCSSGGISTFTIGVSQMPHNFDPQSATGTENLTVINNIFQGLFEKQGDEIVNGVADSYTVSPDGLTYTVKLREDAVYHCKGNKDFEGRPVTAEDFVFSLQRVVNPKTHSPYAQEFNIIKNATAVLAGGDVSTIGVKAIGLYTLVIELERPDSTFLEKLCSPAAFPCNKEFFETTGGAYGLSVNNLISNGPFRLNYLDEENATIVRVDDVQGGVDRIRLIKVEPDDMAKKYEDGAISCYFSYTDENKGYTDSQQIVYNSSVLNLVFNLENNVLSNENIRKALAWYAYSFINSGANMEAVSPAGSIFPGTTMLSGKPLADSYKTTPAAYLDQNSRDMYTAGYSETGGLANLTVLIPNDSMYSIIYENINQLWQKDLNRYMKVEYLSTSQIKQRVENGNFDLAFMPVSANDNTPFGILDRYCQYDSQLSNIVEHLKSRPLTAADTNEIALAESIVLDSAFLVPMGTEHTTFYYKTGFSNVYANSFSGVINLKYTKVN